MLRLTVSTEDAPTDWRVPFIKYIRDGDKPDNKAAAERLIRHVASYTLIGDDLYKHSAAGILLKCIDTTRGKSLLLEIHAG